MHSDVWLCRLEGDDKNRLLTISRVFRVDVRGARHILEHLPRLVARNLPSAEARKLGQRLREAGGLVHVCATGATPDFRAVLAAPTAVRGAAPAKQAAPRRSQADDAALAAARTANDSALAHFPESDAPCAWDPDPALRPPPVPMPIRHSAARVAWTLLAALAVLGGGASVYWQQYGHVLLKVAVATPVQAQGHAVVPRAKLERDAGAAKANDAQRRALAARLATDAHTPAFATTTSAVVKALGREPTPLAVLDHVVGVSFELREAQAAEQLEALYLQVTGQGALLFRQERQARVGIDRVALLPTDDPLAVVELFGTSGSAIGNDEVVSWLRGLRAKRALRVLGVGEHFLEGRFETPSRGESGEAVTADCPGASDAPPIGAEGEAIKTLQRLRRGERFACTFK
ncbi:MAG: hypothetical protein ACHQ53_05030 [Polyangiales bacterium]